MGTKQAIAVSGPAEAGQDFIGGMPAGEPKTRFSAPQLIESIKRRQPIQDRTEYGAGVPLGMESTQQTMLERLTMKWANDPFTAGFMDAVQAGLDKDAGLGTWMSGLVGGAAKATAAPKPIQPLQAALKSKLTPKAIAPSGTAAPKPAAPPAPAADVDPWGGGHSEGRMLRRLDAHAARTRPAANAAPRPEWKPFYQQKGS